MTYDQKESATHCEESWSGEHEPDYTSVENVGHEGEFDVQCIHCNRTGTFYAPPVSW